MRPTFPHPGRSGARTWTLCREPINERSEEMLALYPISDKYPAYDPWMKEQRALLDDNYARDLQKIARMPGVSLLGHANNQREA